MFGKTTRLIIINGQAASTASRQPLILCCRRWVIGGAPGGGSLAVCRSTHRHSNVLALSVSKEPASRHSHDRCEGGGRGASPHAACPPFVPFRLPPIPRLSDQHLRIAPRAGCGSVARQAFYITCAVRQDLISEGREWREIPKKGAPEGHLGSA